MMRSVNTPTRTVIPAILSAVLAGPAVTTVAAGENENGNWLAAAEAISSDSRHREDAAAPPADEAYRKPVPLSFSIDYTLVSDYIWRGANFSEYRGEGREKPNHQLGLDLSMDLADVGVPVGTVGFNAWFEWFGGQDSMAPGSDSHLQEADYTIYWSYDFDEIGVGVEAGWIAYDFPNAGGDGGTSYEVYGSVSFNDGLLFGTEEGILNPYVTYYYDYDLVNAGWLEFGISHDFDLSAADPSLKGLTVTPSLTLGVDNRYWDRALGTNHESTRLGALVYGLSVSYNLSEALALPEEYGSLSIGGFLGFSDAMREDLLNDECYGGTSISWEW